MSVDMKLIRKMDYYADRTGSTYFWDIADKCTKGILDLSYMYFFDVNNYEGNFFCHKFDGKDAALKKEYLFAMDYLSHVLNAYKASGKMEYKKAFEGIISKFHEYLEMEQPFYQELAIYAQTLLFIKALDIFGEIPYEKDFIALLEKYTVWLMNDNNYFFNNNHGLFEDFALLHISVLLEKNLKSGLWQKYAIDRINGLFEVAYYNDFTNNENSSMYFNFNNYLYEQIVNFCNHYNICGIEKIEKKLEKSKEVLNVFAHNDLSLPLIGDGEVFNGSKCNKISKLFPDIGIAILKVDDVYFSFKCKTIYQSHAHTDVSSVTARYKNIDFLVDSGQYNYDRYTPINRFVRSSAGHSGVFPIFADAMFQEDFCKSIKYSGITEYKSDDSKAFVKGEYKLNDVNVCREISILPNQIIIKDHWICEKRTCIRQRFIIPKELIENSRFTASKRTLESEVENVKFKYEIKYDLTDLLTTVQFGVASYKYDTYETTMILDTIAENTLSGEITAQISFEEKL